MKGKYPDNIFEQTPIPVTKIALTDLRHTDLGERVIRVDCKANGVSAKRLTQEIYGQPVNKVPVWHIEGQIVAEWFAKVLEAEYEKAVTGKIVIIHTDLK